MQIQSDADFLKAATARALSLLSDQPIILPRAFNDAFVSSCRDLSTKSGVSNGYALLYDESVYSAKALERAISGAELVSVSASEAILAIKEEDSGALAELSRELEVTKAEMEVLRSELEGFRASRADIKEVEDLRRRVFSDGLTMVRNRSWMTEFIADADGNVKDGMVISFIDMSDFKTINDRFGHESGDNALCFVAKELEAAMRDFEGVSIVRYGGDEFVIFTPGEVTAEDVDACLLELKQGLNKKPLSRRGDVDAKFFVDFAYGSVCTNRGDSLSSALTMADDTMYERKVNDKLAKSADDAFSFNEDGDPESTPSPAV